MTFTPIDFTFDFSTSFQTIDHWEVSRHIKEMVNGIQTTQVATKPSLGSRLRQIGLICQQWRVLGITVKSKVTTNTAAILLPSTEAQETLSIFQQIIQRKTHFLTTTIPNLKDLTQHQVMDLSEEWLNENYHNFSIYYRKNRKPRPPTPLPRDKIKKIRPCTLI